MKSRCYSQLLIQTGIAIISMVIFASNAYAELAWTRAYGGTNADFARRIQQTTNGGYILLANTYSFDNNYVIAGYTESFSDWWDFWVIKLAPDGSIIWQKRYGGDSREKAFSVQQSSDGNYLIAGGANSFSPAFEDIWILKLEPNGDVL